jgi:hypothetical protein
MTSQKRAEVRANIKIDSNAKRLVLRRKQANPGF